MNSLFPLAVLSLLAFSPSGSLPIAAGLNESDVNMHSLSAVSQLRIQSGSSGSQIYQTSPSSIASEAKLYFVQFTGTDACTTDEFGGRCPGETVRECIIRCNKTQDDLEEGCGSVNGMRMRAICYGEAALWGGECRASCK
jgi:hypothetical protein